MMLATYTLIHVLLSLVGIGSGLIVVFGMLSAKRSEGLTALFLATTVATSVTGFGFPVDHFLPSHAVGILSLLALLLAILALYLFHLERAWRWIYVVCAALALYFKYSSRWCSPSRRFHFCMPLRPRNRSRLS